MRRLARTAILWGAVAALVGFAPGPAAPGFTPPAALAAEAGAGRVLTLEEGLRIALERSAGAQVAASRVRQGEAQLAEAKSVLHPTLVLGGGADRGRSIGTMGLETRWDFSTTLAYNQVVARTASIRYAIEQGELGLEVSRLQAESERLAVLANVVNGYVAVLEAQSALELSRALARNAEAMARITEDRVTLGAATEADLLAARAGEARARQGVKVAEDSVRLAYEALLKTIGLTVEANGRGEPPALQSIDEIAGLFSMDEDWDTLSERAMRARPEILQAEAAVELARAGLLQFEASDRPTAELTGAYTWVEDDGTATLSFSLNDKGVLGAAITQSRQSPASAQQQALAMITNELWQIGAKVTWTFADGGASDSRRKQLAEQVRQAELRLEDARRGLLTALAAQYNEVVHAIQELSIAEQSVLEARARYDATVKQFEAGTSTQVEVWQAEAQLVRARHERVLAVGRLARAYTALTTGTGITADEWVGRVARAAAR